MTDQDNHTSPIELFLTHLQSEDLSPGTIANYSGNLRLFGLWLAGHGKTLTTLTPADLKEYKAELKDRYKPKTINTKLTCISILFRWCVENGHIKENPMTKIKGVRFEQYAKWLSQEQVQLILQAAQTTVEEAEIKQLNFSRNIAIRMQGITIFLLNTGLRVSELCDLRLSDLHNGTITVRWGKGSRQRQVPLNDQAEAALQTWLLVRQSVSDYVFTSENKRKERMTRQLVQWHLSHLGQRSGFRLTPHLLRHTFGKNLINKGVSLDRVAKLMGHSDINTTAIYTMPSLEDLRQDVKRLD